MKSPYKLLGWFFFLVFVLEVGTTPIYSLYNYLFTKEDSAICYLYATNNKYTEDIFFVGAEEETKFISDLYTNMDGIEDVVVEWDNYELRLFLDEHIDEVLEIAKANDGYIEYLARQGSTLDDLSNFVHKMALIDDHILRVTMYTLFLIICAASLGAFKYRKGFYIAAAIIYVIAMTSVFSGGLTDYVVTKIINVLVQINQDSFTYYDMELFNLYLMDTLKESFMTVIIFDTILQFGHEKNEIQKKKNIRYVFQSLDVQINYLETVQNQRNVYIARLNIPSMGLEKECKEAIKKWEKSLEVQKDKNCYYYKYKRNYEGNKTLYEKLSWIRTNNEAYSNEYYISILKEIKELMIECEYNQI